MTFPTLPISARTEVTIESNFTPNLFQQDNGYVERKSRNYRKVAKGTANFSTYLDDIATVTDFLHQQQGYKPFVFLQNGLAYTCKAWTVTYSSGNKGVIQMSLTKYTN